MDNGRVNTYVVLHIGMFMCEDAHTKYVSTKVWSLFSVFAHVPYRGFLCHVCLRKGEISEMIDPKL